MSPPLVSIVVPSFQQARFLRAAIDSVLEQDYAPIEVLVMDGGSTDGSVDILREYGDRIWFRSERDGGQCQAINEGFRRSRGEIVAWLNSDDIYYPGAVRRAVEVLVADPDAALVYGEGNLIDEHGEVLYRFPETVPFDLWRLTNVADYILQPTVFFRRDALFASGLLREDLNWGLDWDLWLRIGKRMRFGYVPEVLAAGRIYDQTKTATGGFRRLRELLRILRAHGAPRFSPAAVAHTITTIVRRLRLSPDQITAAELTRSVPRGVRGAALRPLSWAERRLRTWLENAQGLWRDGLVGRKGVLWLPSDGGGGELVLSGHNLDLADQVIAVRCAGRSVQTPALAPGESFELRVPLPRGEVPVKARLRCARTLVVDPLEPRLGRRRAGAVLERRGLAE